MSCRCHAASATCGMRIRPWHRSRQTTMSERKGSESPRHQVCPQSGSLQPPRRPGPQAGAEARVTLTGGWDACHHGSLGPWARAACRGGQLLTFACSLPEECAQGVGGAGKRLF